MALAVREMPLKDADGTSSSSDPDPTVLGR